MPDYFDRRFFRLPLVGGEWTFKIGTSSEITTEPVPVDRWPVDR